MLAAQSAAQRLQSLHALSLPATFREMLDRQVVRDFPEVCRAGTRTQRRCYTNKQSR